MYYLLNSIKTPKSCRAFLSVALFLFSCLNVFATTLSIGTSATQTKTPINFYYTDTYQGCQMIYTEDELSDFRKGAEITAISFYYENTSTSDKVPSINFSVKMGTTTSSYFSSNTNLLSTSSLTEVANKTIGGWDTKSSGWVTIELKTPFVYTGGNILIDIRNTSKGEYLNNVYFASTNCDNYKTLSWTGASSATTTSISSGSRTQARPNIQFTYTLYSELTGESGITHLHCPEAGSFCKLYEEAGCPRKVKVSGCINGYDFWCLSLDRDSENDNYYCYLNTLDYLDLSEVTIEEYVCSSDYRCSTENNKLSFKFQTFTLDKLVLPDNCEYFYYEYRYDYWSEIYKVINNVYTRNHTPFGMTFNNVYGILHVPSGTKMAWQEQLANGTNNGNSDNYINNTCVVADTPIKTLNNCFNLTSTEIANVDVLYVNCDINAADFKVLNKMPQLNKLVINGNILAYTGSGGPLNENTTYKANEIPTCAFKGNTSLCTVELSNCNKIGDYAFQNATNLRCFTKHMAYDNHTSIIGDYAFDGCVNLNKVENPSEYGCEYGFTSIGDFAFRNTRLSRISLSSRCESYDEWGDNYDSYYVPFTHIGKNPFFGVYSTYGIKSYYGFLYSYGRSNNSGPFSLDEDCSTNYTGVYLLIKDSTLYASAFYRNAHYTYDYEGKYTMESKIKHVADYGLSDVWIEELTISSTLKTVGEAFLYKCPDLKSIKGSSPAFVAKDSVMYNVDMSTLVKYPSNHPFTEFHLPLSVKYIEKWAFEGVKNLTALYVYKKEPIDIERDVFENVDKDALTLYVPYGCKSAYMAAEGWSEFENIVELDPTEVAITINEYGSATYCSPFALDFSEVEGLKAYTAIGFNSSTQVVTLARVMTAPAETGIFIKGEPGEYVVPTIEVCNDHTLNLLVGTLEPTVVNSTDGAMSNYKFTVADGDTAPMFYPFEDGTTLSGGKAYLQIPTAWLPVTAQKSLNIRFDDGETTDIDELKGENGEVKTIYDLQGRVVENPTSGIYIINGKKVIIK